MSYNTSLLGSNSAEPATYVSPNSHKRKRELYETFKDLYGKTVADKLLAIACKKGQPALKKQTFFPRFPPEEITQLVLSHLNLRDLPMRNVCHYTWPRS